ncbi:MAG: hypothetical protein WCV82_01950 [Candidatus Paceibacterota bacterium]
MNDLQIKALLAGVFFGIWPLFMSKSGLNGNVSAMAFAGCVLIFVTPFALNSMGSVGNVNWWMVIAAGVFSAIGVLLFNGMLAKATTQNIGTMIVLQVIAQVVIPAVYQTIMSGNISAIKISGFALAAIASVLLIKG